MALEGHVGRLVFGLDMLDNFKSLDPKGVAGSEGRERGRGFLRRCHLPEMCSARPARERKGPAEGCEAGEGTAEGAAGDEIIGTCAIGRARAFGDGG